jgi:hypothetical protein
LCTVKHAKPYRFDSGEVKVTKQVVVPFSIGKYVDKILCDVVLMQANQILLGRPWQYDRKEIHDGVKNRYTIVKDGKTITLIPLTPKQVYDDQIKLKSEHEVMGKENQGEEQGERRASDSARTQTTTTHSATHPNTSKYSANTPNKSNHSTTTQKHPNLAESEGKTRGAKKMSKDDENCVEKLKKQPNFYAREGEVRSVFFTNKPMILLVYKEAHFNTNDFDHIVASVAIALLQEFDDVFPNDTLTRPKD